LKISLRSFTDSATHYQIDLKARTCSCPAFSSEGWCKHLQALGKYKPRTVTLSARPSFSQALSGVVKAIRIRDVEEGAYWLQYCWGFREKLNGSQFRIVRRLLIGSAEDGHSIAVMEKVAENFASLLAKDVAFPRVVAELIRICSVPNWWHPRSGGHDYINAGLMASRQMLYDRDSYSPDQCLAHLASAIEERDKVSALFVMMKAYDTGLAVGLPLAQCLLEIAQNRNHIPVQRLIEKVYMRHARALTDDSNFIGIAAWMLAGGESPVADRIEPVLQGDVRQLMERVQSIAPHSIPEWCCDGVHCAGNDVRYMGMWDRMGAVCRQFDHYGRVSPDDLWLEDQFYPLDGLNFTMDLLEESVTTNA
jgi:hypothetical protein